LYEKRSAGRRHSVSDLELRESTKSTRFVSKKLLEKLKTAFPPPGSSFVKLWKIFKKRKMNRDLTWPITIKQITSYLLDGFAITAVYPNNETLTENLSVLGSPRSLHRERLFSFLIPQRDEEPLRI